MRELRQVFIDICRGYSTILFSGEIIYIKHLSHEDYLNLDILQEKFLQNAISKGLPDEKSRIEWLKSQGLWTDKKEREIFDQKSYVRGMAESRKIILLPSKLKQLNEQIKQEELKLYNLEKDKNDLVGITADRHSTKLINDYYIFHSLYKDKDFKDQFFSKDEFDNLDDDFVFGLMEEYDKTFNNLSDFNIKKLCIQSFYQEYFYLCVDDIPGFFGRPICQLTLFQVKLAGYSRYFKNLISGVDMATVPEKSRSNPDDLVQFLDTKRKGQEALDKSNTKNVSIVGATREDIKTLGGKMAEKPSRPMSKEELAKHYNT